ncbi:MAG TPA: uroporphyrinogen-III C-methyltransferase [Candidatus Acidoferrales bacterium]|nr:uroporphyrinogen-III C-methyltransferase [Candidatus Acidoferrales bacterium]
MPKPKQGKVFLVGAGPGDPELLTLKAHRLLREARLVLHDDLVPAEILALAGPHAKIVNVGKRCGAKRITQAEINAQMIRAAREGTNVVRLKSGDPAIFGRLGEELDALSDAHIAFEVVPGITAGIAAAAALGMSLTDRRTASRLLIASAHHASENPSAAAAPPKQDWSGVARGDTTLMIYMPGHGVANLRDELLAAGLAADTPAIIVSNATTRRQRHRHTTLAEIGHGPQLEAPSVLLIGRALARNRASQSEEISLLIEQAESVFAGK